MPRHRSRRGRGANNPRTATHFTVPTQPALLMYQQRGYAPYAPYVPYVPLAPYAPYAPYPAYAPYANAPMQQCHNWNVAAAAPFVAPVPSAAAPFPPAAAPLVAPVPSAAVPLVPPNPSAVAPLVPPLPSAEPSSIASPLTATQEAASGGEASDNSTARDEEVVAPVSDPPPAVPITRRRGRAPPLRHDSDHRRSPPLDDVILISDSDNDSDHWTDFGFNFAQDVPEDVPEDNLECPVDKSHFVVGIGKLEEDHCTLCCQKYDDVNPLAILHTCHHFLCCYVCACRLHEMGHKCPWCRKVIKSVTSQEFNKALLVQDNQHEIEASVEQEQESEMDHDAREQQILAELEEVPDNMKATKEDLEKLSHDAAEILKLVTTLHCKKHLQSIARGRTQSERHGEYQEGGMLFSGFGPFTLFEDMKTEFFQIIGKHCAKNSTMDNPTYQWSVLIPEAIIYGAQILFQCSKVDATAYFEKTSKLVSKVE